MPIPNELRKLYRGPAYRARRRRALERSEYCCTKCGLLSGAIYFSRHAGRMVEVQLGMAHLDGNTHNWSEENLAMLCRRCHLLHDAGQHKQTRCVRKDAKRPMTPLFEAAGVLEVLN